MSDLRILLLVVGCLFIVGIYCWEVFFKSEPKRKDNILDAIDDMPDLPSTSLNEPDQTDDYTGPLINIGNMISQSHQDEEIVTDGPYLSSAEVNVTTDEDSETDSIPVISKTDYFDDGHEATTVLSNPDGESSRDESTTDNFAGVDFDLFSKQESTPTIETEQINNEQHMDVDNEQEQQLTEPAIEEETSMEAEPGAEAEPQNGSRHEIDDNTDRQLGQSGDDLIVLYVTSPAQTMFNGLSISKAADEVGMIYGHMNVFHHFGPGKLHSGQPLFSMANMFEPGSFDLGRMADLRTKGVVLFMYSPASIEPKVVFELFLNTTQRVAEMLNGEIRTEDNQVLTSTGIKSLRLKAEQLAENE